MKEFVVRLVDVKIGRNEHPLPRDLYGDVAGVYSKMRHAVRVSLFNLEKGPGL